jgi:DNA-nicking Smr family endonuclease
MSIFRKRNSPKSVFSDFRLDLHGLHVQEARECVLSVLAEISQSFSSRSSFPKVTIITGTGHHTNGPQKGVARVLKAVESLCEEYGLSYVHIKDPRGFVGGVLVQLREDVLW